MEGKKNEQEQIKEVSDKKPEQENNSQQDKESQPKDTKTKFFDDIYLDYIQSFKNKDQKQLMFDSKFQELIKKRKFWDNQPVPKPGEIKKLQSGPIQPKKSKEELKDQVKLPDNFYWEDFDLEEEDQITQIYTLLTENYVEDEDGCFRFDYSKEFLQWALLTPGYSKDLFFGIRDKNQNNKLVGFISGIILNLKIEQKIVKVTEVNFLCVHKHYRNHYMASVLIREVVRRSNLLGIWQGLYTSGTMLPTPISQTRYYHRSLNPRKLINVNFSYLPKNQKISTREKLYELPQKYVLNEGQVLRPAELKDMKQVHKLLNEYLSKFSIHPEFTKKECQHWFIRREGILESFVIEKDGKVTDFFSFYNLPSSILKHPKYKKLKAAYSYYLVNTSISLKDLYMNALIKAKELDYDVFNALDIMENKTVFEDLLFSGGDGYLQYYLYNWKLNKNVLYPNEIGMVLM